jgi:hypothetical protein
MTPRQATRTTRAALAPACIAALAAALVFAGAARPLGADGVTRGEDGFYYSTQAAFRIPFTIDNTDRRIKKVLLQVSTDLGQSYQFAAQAAPNDREFRFTATRDGEYWFAVQTQDDRDMLFPPDLSAVRASLKVRVATQKPNVRLSFLSPRDGQVGVEWEAVSAYLDATSLQLDYRIAGGQWTPLPAKATATGTYYWTPGGADLEVRLTVRDKAGNVAEQRATSGGAAKPGGAPPPADPGHSGVKLVNKRQIVLDYTLEDVGPSKVKSVEVWFTQDGRKWQKTPEDAGPKPPYVLQVDKDGRWGFTLIARSGAGLSEPPPQSGDPPQIWVEVDETKPQVRVEEVSVGRGPELGRLTVRWSASDKNMAPMPIKIEWAENASGPWTLMAGSLPNDGRYVWSMPAEIPPLIYVRVTAVDLAENVGDATWERPINTDLKVPKARAINVKAADAPRSPP